MNDHAAMLASRALARILADRDPTRAWTPDPDLQQLRHQSEERATRPGAAGNSSLAALPRRAA